ncbi:MAG: hypothetical protein ACO1TE_11345 [Prosthecobacter sp.]
MFLHTICSAWARLFQAACLWSATLAVSVPAAGAEGEPERLLKELSALEQADVGLSSVVSGSSFPPVEGQHQVGVGQLNHGVPHATSRPVRRLVELGPAALPTLLKHLDDKAPTKLLVTHDGFFGAMWRDTEVPAPGDAENELQAIRAAGIKPRDPAQFQDSIKEHRVTVGDTCFVIIGMITNRSYNAVRYQPTACQVINSPTSSPQIAKAVRGIWQQHDDAEGLHEHLLRDLARDDPGAATRLLYYFQTRAAEKVLQWLNSGIQARSSDLSRRVNAVAWCEHPQIRQAVQSLVQTSTEADIVAAGAAAFQTAPLATTLELTNRWKSAKQWQGVEASTGLLKAALIAHPDARGQAIDAFVRKASTEALAGAFPVLYVLKNPPVRNLAPLLADTRKGYGRYLRDGKGVQRAPTEKHHVDYRVCDNVYEIICRALGDAETRCTGTPTEMDVRIKELQSRLKLDASAWPFSKDEVRSRQDAQNTRKKARDQVLAEIKSRAKDSFSLWRLTLAEDRLEPDDWSEAALHLLSPDIDEPTNMETLLGSLHHHPERALDSLPDGEKKQIVQTLSRRLAEALDKAPKDEHPSVENAKFAVFVGCCVEGSGQPVLARLVQMMSAAFHQHGWPEDEALDTTIMLLDMLVGLRVTGASEYYLELVHAATPERLEGGFDLREFFQIMTRDSASPALTQAAEWCFARPNSPWRLSLHAYDLADELGSTELLSLPAFRADVIEAMSHVENIGELSLREDDSEYCWIEWTKGGSSGMSVDEGETAGVKPGQRMPIRRCDAILEGVASAVFAEHEGPPFHLYWPLQKRDEGIARWIKFLKELK